MQNLRLIDDASTYEGWQQGDEDEGKEVEEVIEVLDNNEEWQIIEYCFTCVLSRVNESFPHNCHHDERVVV